VPGPRADGELHPAEDLVRVLPPVERAALVGADDEEGISEAPAAHRVDGERVRVRHDLDRPEPLERGSGHAQPRVGVGDDLPMTRALLHEDGELVDRQLLERRAGERHMADVRRVEGAAE
jgi:hypothetical protein